MIIINFSHSHLQALQNQLIQANKLSEMYRDQVIGVEGELSRLREEDSLNRTLYNERCGMKSLNMVEKH